MLNDPLVNNPFEAPLLPYWQDMVDDMEEASCGGKGPCFSSFNTVPVCGGKGLLVPMDSLTIRDYVLSSDQKNNQIKYYSRIYSFTSHHGPPDLVTEFL